VGGKRQLLKYIKPILPESINTYYEPFIGGGALLFDHRPNVAVINDYNKELINTYNVIRGDVEALIADLKTHVYDKDYFYEIRSLDRNSDYSSMSDLKKASR